MRWWLALFGWLWARLPGAVVGYLIGWAIESNRVSLRRPKPQGHTGDRLDVIVDLVTLAVAVARADGNLDRAEVRAIRHFFEHGLGFRGPRLSWLQAALKDEVSAPGSWTLAATRLADALQSHELALLLRVLTAVALADGRAGPEELRLLADLAARWGVPLPEPQTFTPHREPDRKAWARRVLNVTADATPEEIDRAYKQLVREKHPDRFVHLGEELAKAAHEQFVEIQEAYRVLTKA